MSPAQRQWLETTALEAASWDTTISTTPILMLSWGGAAATPCSRGFGHRLTQAKGAKAPATTPRKVLFYRSAIQ